MVSIRHGLSGLLAQMRMRRHLEEVAILFRQALQAVRHLVDVDLCHAAATRPLAVHARERLDDLRVVADVGLHAGRDESKPDEIARHFGVIRGRQVRDVLQEGKLQLLVDCRHQPPVENAQPPIARAQQVARVRVAVQQASREEHREVGVEGDTAQLRDVVGLRALETFAVDPLCHQHTLRAEGLDDLWRGHDIRERRVGD